MIKFLGCLLIVFSSVFAGLSYIKKLRKRANGITAMIELLSVLKIKINYDYSPLPEILKQMHQSCVYPISIFLDECVLSLNQGDDLKAAWTNGVNKFSEQMNLTKGDTNILSEFSVCLGDSDINGQISNIQLYTEMLRNSLSEAEVILKEKSKVTLSCSLFGGLIFIVMLI